MIVERPTPASPWLASFRPNPKASLNLFCFPYSGASAALYFPWLDALPKAIEVVPVQLPGRGTRLAEPPYTRLEPLIAAAAEALLPYLEKPFAFFGHSLGALVSFELARALYGRYGVRPVHMFVSGHQAPHLPDPEPPIHALPEAEFIQKLRQLNGTPAEVLENPELRELVLPVLRADFAVCETYNYHPGEPLDLPLTALGGLQDPFVNRDHLQSWQVHTIRPITVRMLPGDHFYLNRGRDLLLRVLAQELFETLRGLPGARGHSPAA